MMRLIVQFLVLGAFFLGLASARQAPHQDPHQAEHLRNLYVERRLALETAWAEADESARQRVRASLRAQKSGGQPALYAASAQLLTDARSMLLGSQASITDLPIQTRVACSLDLMVLPGAFGAVDRDRGDALIVRVLPAYTRLFARVLPEQVQLTMIWVSPKGEEIRARSEPIHRGAFVLPGFEMYFHAPPSEPGTWHLIPEVEWDGIQGRGVAVPVQGVRSLFDRFDRLVAAHDTQENPPRALRALERILMHGGRDAGDPSVETLLRFEEVPLPAANTRNPFDWAPAGTSFRLSVPEGGSPNGVVVVVSPVLHEAEWAMVGDEGRHWRGLAHDHQQEVILTELPILNPRGPDVLALLGEVRRTFKDLPVTLVLHGSGFGRLQLALSRPNQRPLFDRLVVDSVLWGAPTRALTQVPALYVSPLEEVDRDLRLSPASGGSEGGAPSVYEVRSKEPPVISGARLPLWVGQWIALLDGLASQGGRDS